MDDSQPTVLMITHMASMIAQFNMHNIRILTKLGAKVEVASNFVSDGNTMTKNELDEFRKELNDLGVKTYQVDFQRRMGSLKSNVKAYKQLKKIVKDDKVDLIHCQSPLGGVLGRIVGRTTRTRVLYTCHGFQFFKGGPIKDWILYYPVELILSYWTDTIVTINSDDYKIAKKMHFNHRKYIPGVGLPISQLGAVKTNLTRLETRNKLGLEEKDFVVASVGELSYRKNHQVVIRAIDEIDNKKIKYIIAGVGKEKENLVHLINELGLQNQVTLLGYQNNPEFIYSAADIAAFPSRREGLGLAGLEAMAVGLPLLTTNMGGIADYSVDSVTGFVASADDVDGFKNGIQRLFKDKELLEKIGKGNRKKVEMFSHENVDQIMKATYSRLLLN